MKDPFTSPQCPLYTERPTLAFSIISLSVVSSIEHHSSLYLAVAHVGESSGSLIFLCQPLLTRSVQRMMCALWLSLLLSNSQREQ